jgi:glycosyltransferase involved in cell wall biosynthesis
MRVQQYTTESRPLRILLSAYACEPGKGSEPGVGWNWVRELSTRHEVWVLTRSNNRGPIQQALSTEPLEGAHFVFFDFPRWFRFWKRGQRGIRLYYYLWQLGAYFKARKLNQEVKFDVAHHVTFVKYWMPSLLCLLRIPFIWGPVGGGESMPRPFRSHLSARGRVYETLRDFARSVGECDPFVRLTAKRCALALATTDDSKARLIALGCREVRVFSEAGLGRNEITALGDFADLNGSTIRFLSSGNLLHLKGFELSLRAFARAVTEDSLTGEYWLLGDGPERKRLETLAAQLGVKDRVVFWGRLKRAQALEKLAECEVLVHPSLHDSGGWVCLEAMAAGRPVICLDLGGPGLQVTDCTGIKVTPSTPKQVVSDLANAMKRISEDHELRQRLGQGARNRVHCEFAWAKKGLFMHDVYLRAITSYK